MAKKKKKRKKPEDQGVKWWRKKAWEEFSKFIRLRDALETTGTVYTLLCFTCDKPYPAFGKGCAQAGHFVAGRKNAVLFQEKGCHAQCYNCNINLKGNTLVYRRKMIEKYGIEETERQEALAYVTLKYQPVELEEIRDKYKQKRGVLADARKK